MKYIKKIIFLMVVTVLFSQYINSTEENLTIDLDNLTIEDNSSELMLDEFNYTNETNESIYTEPFNESTDYNGTISEEINQTPIIEEIINDSVTKNITDDSSILKEDEKNTTSEIKTKPKFATLINDKTTDTPEIKEYFKVYKNFSHITFKDAHKKEFGKKSINFEFRTKHEQKSKNGILADNEIFLVDLVDCNEERQDCDFRINGVFLLAVKQGDLLQIKGKYNLRINKIEFNYCGNKRFCDFYYDAYDKVDADVIGG